MFFCAACHDKGQFWAHRNNVRPPCPLSTLVNMQVMFLIMCVCVCVERDLCTSCVGVVGVCSMCIWLYICVSLYGICGGGEEEGWGRCVCVFVCLSVGVYAWYRYIRIMNFVYETVFQCICISNFFRGTSATNSATEVFMAYGQDKSQGIFSFLIGRCYDKHLCIPPPPPPPIYFDCSSCTKLIAGLSLTVANTSLSLDIVWVSSLKMCLSCVWR